MSRIRWCSRVEDGDSDSAFSGDGDGDIASGFGGCAGACGVTFKSEPDGQSEPDLQRHPNGLAEPE